MHLSGFTHSPCPLIIKVCDLRKHYLVLLKNFKKSYENKKNKMIKTLKGKREQNCICAKTVKIKGFQIAVYCIAEVRWQQRKQ